MEGGVRRETVSDSSRAVISAVNSLLTALGRDFDPKAAFDAAGFVAELTEESDNNLALTITMPVLFCGSAASTDSFTTKEAQRVGKQCLLMLLGSTFRLEKDSNHKISREVTAGVCGLTAAAYLGNLLRFSQTEQFKAAWAE